MNLALVFALFSLALTVGYLIVFASLHLLPTGYDPIHHAVSDYAVGKYGALFTFGLWLSAFGVVTLAVALHRSVGVPPLASKDMLFLLLVAVSRIGMTLFPTDVEGNRISRTGLLHYGLAIAAFTFTYLAISDMTAVLRGLDSTRWVDGPLRVSNSVVGPELALVVLTMLRPLRKVFGLFERLFLVTTNVWFILVAILLTARAS